MSRISWKHSEVQFLIDNYEDMTTDELCEALGNRSRKSVNRKLEILRDEGKIGFRSRDTVNRAYSQRTRSGGTKSSGGRRSRGRIPLENYGYEEV